MGVSRGSRGSTTREEPRMPRAIDHLVIAAHDLDGQAALYRRLGFQVGARNRHPWGTENHIVQFDGAFLELIGLGPDFVAPSPAAAVHPFAGFLADYLTRREGMAMLVLRSTDAEADRLRFRAAGIGDFARFDFARKGRVPMGAKSRSLSRSLSPPVRLCRRPVSLPVSNTFRRTSGAARRKSIPTARERSPASSSRTNGRTITSSFSRASSARPRRERCQEGSRSRRAAPSSRS